MPVARLANRQTQQPLAVVLGRLQTAAAAVAVWHCLLPKVHSPVLHNLLSASSVGHCHAVLCRAVPCCSYGPQSTKGKHSWPAHTIEAEVWPLDLPQRTADAANGSPAHASNSTQNQSTCTCLAPAIARATVQRLAIAPAAARGQSQAQAMTVFAVLCHAVWCLYCSGTSQTGSRESTASLTGTAAMWNTSWTTR